MSDFDLYDRVAQRLRGLGREDLTAVAAKTRFSVKTLQRIARKERDPRFGTLVAIEKYFRLQR